MTPTTKAALDAAEKAIWAARLSAGQTAECLHLIAEARKAEESDTARLDWMEKDMVGGRTDLNIRYLYHDAKLRVLMGVTVPPIGSKTIREAIDAAMLPAPPEAK